MSETTTNLDLFKYDTVIDAKEPFNINECMNDNWDKIDNFAASVNQVFSSDFSSQLDKKVFSDINDELSQKLEAQVLLASNGYIKFNSCVSFRDSFFLLYIKSLYFIFQIFIQMISHFIKNIVILKKSPFNKMIYQPAL